MTELLFYKKPAPLDKNKHRGLCLKVDTGYAFARNTNSVPLSGPEFFPASKYYPVMFVKTADENFLPVALLSFTPNSHQLGDDWSGVYVPSFLKRYPFALASNSDVIMIDESAPHFVADGTPLFEDSGEPTSLLKDFISYLDDLNKAHHSTLDYTKALKAKGLLVPFKQKIQINDKEIKLDNLYTIPEVVFHESLTEEELCDWFLKGWIAWTYAHMHSLSAFEELAKRLSNARV